VVQRFKVQRFTVRFRVQRFRGSVQEFIG